MLTCVLKNDNIYHVVDGAWLSLVEHLAWDQGVAGSNPAAPTIRNYRKRKLPFLFISEGISFRFFYK